MHPVCKKGCWADKLIERGEVLRRDNDRLKKENAALELLAQDMLNVFMKPGTSAEHWQAKKCFERMFGRKLK